MDIHFIWTLLFGSINRLEVHFFSLCKVVVANYLSFTLISFVLRAKDILSRRSKQRPPPEIEIMISIFLITPC